MSTTPLQRNPSRRRRSAEEVRKAALAEARTLLLASGPGAVTLKAVAERLDMTHSNLLHHFGSAGELQSALMGAMVRDLNDALLLAVANVTDDAQGPRTLVNKVFDAFDAGGAGRLAAWMALTNNVEHVGPIRDAVLDLVNGIEAKFRDQAPDARQRVVADVLLIALLAFGDAVVGQQLAAILGLGREATRALTAQLLSRSVAEGVHEAEQK
jgi:TetR/AcrR family transcriptional regulator, repressor for neighboring sulfatase